MKLSMDLPGGDRLPADSMHSIMVGASNLAGTPVSADVQVIVYPLKAPQRLIRDRLWDAPDVYTLSEKEWLDSFPHDEYKRETQKETWLREGKAWETVGDLPGVSEDGEDRVRHV